MSQNDNIREVRMWWKKVKFNCSEYKNGCTLFPLSSGTPSSCWYLEGGPCRHYKEERKNERTKED